MAYIPFNQIVDALTELDEAQKQMLLKTLQESKNYPILKGKLTSLESIREACFHDGLRYPRCLTHGSFTELIVGISDISAMLVDVHLTI